jgi:hypothetical protein
VIVDGEVVMEGREVKTLDEAEILEKAEKTAQNLLSR